MTRLKVHTGPSNGHSPPSYYKELQWAKIDVKSEESLQKWEAVLHLERKDLLLAIEAFGPVVRDIRRGLLLSNQDNDEEAA